MMKFHQFLVFLSVFGMLFAVGCSLTDLPPTALPPLAEPTPTITPIPADADWSPLREGLARRELIPEGRITARMIALRIDPAHFDFRVHYSPGEPRTLAQWQEAHPSAVAIINANFFTPEFYALGLVISDGQVYGSSYTDRGGTFAVLNGEPLIRSNITTPYRGEAFEQAAQAFPMFVENGVQAYNNPTDTRASRRSVIAQDHKGNILLMVAPFLGLGLHDMSGYLAESELEIVTAFNLDGGGSSMLYIEDDGTSISSLDPVPVIIAVYAK